MKKGRTVIYSRDGKRIVAHEPGYWLQQLEAILAKLKGEKS